MLLVEVDRDNEGNGVLVDKLAAYRAWCELPARYTAKKAFDASLRQPGARTHDLRLWSALYPPTGHEGLPPVALILEPGRKRPRPGTKPLTPEQKKAKEERDHQRMLRRIDAVHAASGPTWHPLQYLGDGITARSYHRALPVVATTLPLLRRFGAGAEIWIRFGRDGWHSLVDALANPDGDELYERQRAVQRRRQEQEKREREEAERKRVHAEREKRRPACTRCGAKFPDERWDEQKQTGDWNDDGLCAGCRQAAAEKERQKAEQEKAAQAAATSAAVATAAAAEVKPARSRWRR